MSIKTSISAKLQSAVAICLVVTLGAASWLQVNRNKHTMTTELRDESRAVSRTLQASLRYSMVNGEMDAVSNMISKVGALDIVHRVQILDRDGTVVFSSDSASLKKKESVREIAAMGDTSSGVFELRKTSDATSIVYGLSPIRAETACLECHKDVKVNQAIGYINLERRAGVALAALTATQIQSLLTNLAVVVILALTLGILTRRIIKPLLAMKDVAGRLAVGDIEQTVDHVSADETGVLADALRGMIAYVQQTARSADALRRGDMTAVVELKSENDVLGRSFQELQATIRSLVAHTGDLVGAAQSGKLDVRANAGGFQGDFRKIIEGVNGTLDTVVQPITEASTVLARVAERDLSARMTGSYQNDLLALKTALNTAVQNLSDALADVAGSAEQVAVASQQIASGSQLLAQGTSEQAAAVEEVSASLQEVSSMSQQNATNAQEAKGMAERGRTSVKSGIDSMDRLTAAIQKIKESSDATARIVKTIDEIAFQTNLLALNAAVEAARAGDAGKGFAVVADEVRSLAIRSAEAAKSTAALIEEGVQASGTGVALNAESLKALQDIDAQMDKIGEMLAEIATASNEQNQGVGQITTAIESVNQTTQSAAANAEESAATSEELSAQAAQMQGIVGSFQLADANHQPAAGVSGKGPAAASRRPAKAPPAPRPAATPPNRTAHALHAAARIPAKNGNGKPHTFDLDVNDEDVLCAF